MADLDRSVVGMAHPAHAPFEVKLLGMNGNEINIFTFEELQWHTVWALVYDMENDNEPGIDGAQTDDEGRDSRRPSPPTSYLNIRPSPPASYLNTGTCFTA